jgi:Tfp pilus assembly protein PilV
MRIARPIRTAGAALAAPLDARGFTLIEAMISLFFLAFIVTDMGLVDTYAKRSTNAARRLTEANTIAEGVLEKSRNTAYIYLNYQFSSADTPPDPIRFDLNKDGVAENYDETCNPASPPNAATTTVTVCTAAVGPYTVTRTVTPFDPTGNVQVPAQLLKDSIAADVDIVVTWVDSKGPQQIRVTSTRSKL